MLDKLLAHPFAFVCICVGIAIILYSAKKCCPHPFDFVKEIVKILLKEFSGSNKERTALERIDAIIICILFVLVIIFFFFETSASVIDQYFGSAAPYSMPVLTSVTLAVLFLAFFISPTWVYLLNRQNRVDRIAKEAAKQQQGQKGVHVAEQDDTESPAAG